MLAAPPIDPERPVRLPGEEEHRRAAERRRIGIPEHRDTYEKLRGLAEEVGVPFTLKRMDEA